MKLNEDRVSPPTVACVFGRRVASLAATFSFERARRDARRRLEELVDPEHEDCLATAATAASSDLGDPADVSASAPYQPWSATATVMAAAGEPRDDRPCKLCGGADR